ncbi:MAG TPA: hypothetical protein ENI60_04615 [Candidatus Fraserbacteria bacterium]|nr:hypothetical protein [Candidatus Fraserbacteria bacterium]
MPPELIIVPQLVREIEGQILSDLAAGKSLILLGPRRSGKTTLLRRLQLQPLSGLHPFFFDCRVTGSLGKLYQALSGAARRPGASAQTSQEYAALTDLCDRLFDLLALYRAHRSNEAALVESLYAFAERLKVEEGEKLPEVAPQSPLSQLLQLKDATGEELQLKLEQLLERLAQLPQEQLPQVLLAGSPPGEPLLTWLRYRNQEISESELMQALLASFSRLSKQRPLLLFDEAQLQAGPEFQPFFAALGQAEGLSFVLSADGLAGELSRLVQRVGPAPRHPFLKMDSQQHIVVRYIGPLAPAEVNQLVKEHLSRVGLSVDTRALALIAECTGGMPPYVQRLLRLCIRQARSESSTQIEEQLVERAFRLLLQEKDPDFGTLFEGLSALQRELLLKIASTRCKIAPEDEPTHEALESLAQRFLIERGSPGGWQVTDRLLRAWLLSLGAFTSPASPAEGVQAQ